MIKYDPKFCQMLIEHGKKGLDYESFAVEVGVHRSTLYDWEKKHADFELAKELSENHRRLLIQKLLIGQSSGKIKGSSPTLIFSAKTILKWKDTVHSEIETGGNDFKITLNYPTPPPPKKDGGEED